MKNVLLVLLGFSAIVLAKDKKATLECPPFRADKKYSDDLVLNDPALRCRSQCEQDSDCSFITGQCGNSIFFNKQYAKEILDISQNAPHDSKCTSENVFKDYKSACVKKQCVASSLNCAAQIKHYDQLVARELSRACHKDSDCSFYTAWGKDCPVAKPVSTLRSVSVIDSLLSPAAAQLERSCKATGNKKCAFKRPSVRCFADECVFSESKLKAHHFVNFEGAEAKVNFQSRTTPLILPDRSEITCEQKADCRAVRGICGQSYLAVHQKYAEKLKQKIAERETSMACFEMKPQAPIVECLLKICVFPEPL